MLRLRVLETLTPITPTTPSDDYTPAYTIVEPVPGEFLSRIRGNRPIEPWILSFARKSVNVKMFNDFIAERALEKKKYGI